MPRLLDDVATPAVLVDTDILDRNIARMAERARAAGIRLRPHAKTHKLLEVGRRQLAAGAAGLSVAKTSEAEVFAAAGFDDLFVAYPVVGEDKGRRLLALAGRVRLAVGVDSVDGARTLSNVFAAAGRRLDVRLKIDVGLHRVGVLPEQAVGVARAIAALPGLELRGVFTHAGQAYGETTVEGIAAVGRHEGATVAAVAEALRAAGLKVAEVSVGSTPTARTAMTVAGVTECRPGNYVYHDASQVSLGNCALEDCAMTVLATVTSVPAPDRAVLDAGSKTVSSDPLRPNGEGFGWVLGRRARLSKLSEEHGVLAVEAGERFRVGERVRVLPNHACVVSNLHDRVLAVRAGVVEEEWTVAARGRVE
jgi:D-serine deaminase-like pyridoxal phosphate-dependent protein